MINVQEHDPRSLGRRRLLATTGAVSAATLLAACSRTTDSPTSQATGGAAPRPKKDSYKMVWIQIQPQATSTAWGQGMKEVADNQKNIDFQVQDGQNKADNQITLMNTAIAGGVDCIFLQPADSVALAPAIAKARQAGIPVITLNIDAKESHAAHVEMNHYYGAMEIADAMAKAIGGTGEVVILNAPPGITIRDLRTNGFKDQIAKKYPNIKIVADQSAEWDRKKAQDLFNAMYVAHPNIKGVYGVNDDMALGAIDAIKAKGLSGIAVFGNDGEKAALESIEAGDLTGTQYTDVWQQGRFAMSAGIVLASGGVNAGAFGQQGHLLMPYTIVTKSNANGIPASSRW